MNKNVLLFALCAASVLAGCASVKIDNPVNGATNVTMPEEVRVTVQGTADLGDVFLDNQNLTTYNNQNWQYTPPFYLSYAPPGPHSFFIAARNRKTGENLGQTATFTVSACPLCYSCPVGNVHPITGQCCENGICDTFAAGNSGVTRINSVECLKDLFPGSSERLLDYGCMRSSTVNIAGTATPTPETAAVRFTASQTGTLRHIRVPIDILSGPNSVQLWITTDVGGFPGTSVESITVTNVRARNLPVRNPIDVYSVTRPTLTAGAKRRNQV